MTYGTQRGNGLKCVNVFLPRSPFTPPLTHPSTRLVKPPKSGQNGATRLRLIRGTPESWKWREDKSPQDVPREPRAGLVNFVTCCVVACCALGRLEPQKQEQERPVVRSDMATPGGATLRNSFGKPSGPNLPSIRLSGQPSPVLAWSISYVAVASAVCAVEHRVATVHEQQNK